MSYHLGLSISDADTLRLLIERHLLDAGGLASFLDEADNHQDGSGSDDYASALRLFAEELLVSQTMHDDVTMARSMAFAVMTDGRVVEEASADERQSFADRGAAERLAISFGATPVQATDINQRANEQALHNESTLADEDVTRLASYYGPSDADSRVDANEGRHTCEVCDDAKSFLDVAQLPCKHAYCRVCLSTLFDLCIRDESVYPPRCCKQEIELSDKIKRLLGGRLLARFADMKREYDTKEKIYCHVPTCSTFIPTSVDTNVEGNNATCPSCLKVTCIMCKAEGHRNECAKDPAYQSLLTLAMAEQWQCCYSCYRIVELDTGCNHIM